MLSTLFSRLVLDIIEQLYSQCAYYYKVDMCMTVECVAILKDKERFHASTDNPYLATT